MALVNGSVDHNLHGRGVEKVWRTVRWAETFADDDSPIGMDTVDLTPPFAIRKIANLFERNKFSDCASIVGNLQGITLASILAEVPIERLHDALPASLPIVEALYIKVHKSGPPRFPTGQLMTDQLVKRLVTVFAHQSTREEGEKVSIVNSCRTILSIIVSFETRLKDIIFQRKRAIDRCIRNMGKHGLVDSSGGKLMLLHDALKVEFEKVLIQYKCALQKLDELSLSTKYPVSTSVSSGPAPSEASHQRLMQVDRAEVQDRIIKNKSLHNVVEPAVSNQHVKKLIIALQRRIEYDKILLFHDTELRKMSEGMANPQVHLSQTLRQFSQGYGQLLALIADILGESTPKDTQFDESSSEDDEKDGGVSITSTLSILERMKIISLNGIIPVNGSSSIRKGDIIGSGRDSLSTIEENNNKDLSPFPATQSHHNKHTNAASSSSSFPSSSSSVIISQTNSSGYREKSIQFSRGGRNNNSINIDNKNSSSNQQNYYHNPHHHHHQSNNNRHYHHPQPHHLHHHHHHQQQQHHHSPIKRANGTAPYISYPIPMGMDHVETKNLQTFFPTTSSNPTTISNGINNTTSASPSSSAAIATHNNTSSSNVTMLEKEITYLRDELAQSREHIHRLQEQEKQMRERLSTFVHHQFTTKSTTAFEDLNLGSIRPTSLIRSYDDLYREGRIDTLDSLDAIPELKGLDILKMKILFSVVVLSFRCVQQSLHELKGRLRHLLCLPPPDLDITSPHPGEVPREMESHINNYLRKTIDTHDITPMINKMRDTMHNMFHLTIKSGASVWVLEQMVALMEMQKCKEVCQNIYATLYDYPGLKQCTKLLDYAKTTVRLAWGLTVQNPPFYILYDSNTFQEQTLTRFHTSDSDSSDVKSFLWPILVDGQTGQCVAKGIVIT